MNRPLFTALLFALATHTVALAEISPEAKECYDWFATLGYPDLKAAPFVRVWIGQPWMISNVSTPITRGGFLIDEDARSFRVLWLDLTQSVFAKSEPAITRSGPSHYEPVPLADATPDLLKAAEDRQHDSASFGRLAPPKLALVVLSYTCWRAGLETDAEDLFKAAAKAAPLHPKPPIFADESATLVLRHALEVEIAESAKEAAARAIRDAVALIGSGDRPVEARIAVLDRFREIAAHSPTGPQHDLAVKMAAILEQMVAEDAAHPQITAEELSQLPIDKQVAEWIFRLRNQSGSEASIPGWCNVLVEENSPAMQLVRIGYPAVPALIAALDDPRSSRAIASSRAQVLLTVGDCAQEILNQISGHYFYVPACTSCYMSTEGKAEATRGAAHAWWEQFRKIGEHEMLLQELRAGETPPYEAMIRLKKHHPEEVEPALLAGAPKAKNPWIIVGYMNALGTCKSRAARAEIETLGSNLRDPDALFMVAHLLKHQSLKETLWSWLPWR